MDISADAAAAPKTLASAATSSTCSSGAGEPPVFLPRVLSRVAAGHAAREGAGIWLPPPEPGEGEKPTKLFKNLDPDELAIYEKLASAACAGDVILPFMPGFYGVVEPSGGMKHRCICLENLLHDFTDGKVMDLKLGVRTFLEKECQNHEPRYKLYQEMKARYPSEVAPAEHEAKAVTKYRWMSVRDTCSTIRSLGFRIDGVAGYDCPGRQLDALRTREEVRDTFLTFVGIAASSTEDGHGVGAVASQVAEDLVRKLKQLRMAMVQSSFVQEHEFIGSSLLLIADAAGTTRVSWIDFAKTFPVPDGKSITHDKSWERGNHEDGIFFGIESIITILSEVIELLEGGSPSSALSRSTVVLTKASLSRSTTDGSEGDQLPHDLSSRSVSPKAFSLETVVEAWSETTTTGAGSQSSGQASGTTTGTLSHGVRNRTARLKSESSVAPDPNISMIPPGGASELEKPSSWRCVALAGVTALAFCVAAAAATKGPI